MAQRIRTWGRTRKGAQRIVVYNEAHLAFIYDESQTAVLQRSGALSDAPNLETAPASERLRRLAEEGVVVVYELPADDPISIEVVVGPPLTEREMSSLPWLKPQPALLRLPSGRLRVDSMNTLPAPLYALPPYPKAPDPEPGLVEVPPGDYVLTLHRLDTDAASRRRDLAVDGPNEIVTLTPLAQAERPGAIAPLLAFEGNADLSWPGRYTIEGRIFKGLALFQGADSQLILNLDREAADALGLRAGMGLQIAVSSLGIEIESFLTDDQFTDEISPPRKATRHALRAFADTPERERRRFPRDLAAGEWVRAADWYHCFGVRLPASCRTKEFLRFFRLGRATRVAGALQSEWLAAEVEVLPQPNLPESYLRRIANA
ncbi:MAG: hypothetical protein ACREL9_11040 [Gemmatimonadales bacterium]